MTLRRGFKAEANAHSIEMRRELRLQKHDPLCPWQLAEYLEIPLLPLSALGKAVPGPIRFLMGPIGRDLFSAVTIFVGRHGHKRAICHNDGNAKTRQAADISHELAHALLLHPPTPPFEIDPIAEEEAKWLGPSLLVSEDAALHIAKRKLAIADAAKTYGVSEKLMRMRLNVTGAPIRAMRSRGT
jgi:IrrE N-terminal-like domain